MRGKAEKIADLEERVKTWEFMIRDARWTLKTIPKEIARTKKEIKQLGRQT